MYYIYYLRKTRGQQSIRDVLIYLFRYYNGCWSNVKKYNYDRTITTIT